MSLRALTLSLLTIGAACVTRPHVVHRPSGLQYRVLARGTGPAAQPGQRVTIHETTTLPSGRLIYSSRGGSAITFQLGASQVIAGVDEGVTGIRTSYPANTPPDLTLHIDVELVEIHSE